MNSGSRSCSLVATSSNAAVTPPTCTLTSVPAVAAGSTSWRRCSMRSTVAASCDEVVGMTWMMAASTASLGRGGLTKATPGVALTSSTTVWRVGRSCGPVISAASSSGPLAPAPKPSALRS